MKKIVLTALTIFGLSTTMFAQQDELKAAAASLEKKDYVAALDNISKAKKAVSKLISDNLASVLPAKLGEYVMQEDPYGGGMEMGGPSVTRVYRKPKPAASKEAPAKAEGEGDMMNAMEPSMTEPAMGGMEGMEEIRVQITTNMMMASEVMNAHSNPDEGMMGNDQVKAYRVKGYRAITRSFGGEGDPGLGGTKAEQAQAVVGGAFISVDAQGLKESGQAEKLLNLIDFEKLVGIVGK
jgi:hypothetical protein